MSARHGGWMVALAALVACGSPPAVGGGDGSGGRVELVAGGGQSQVAGYPLGDTIVVRLVDGDGAPHPFAVIDAAVDATDEAPYAAVTSLDARTRADGTARFVWRLGLALGPQTLRVSSTAATGVVPLAVVATATSNRFRALGGSHGSLCAVDLSGQLGCWPPLADAVRPPRFVPHPTSERFTTLALYRLRTGSHRGCGVATTGRIWCFDVDGAVVDNLVELPGNYPPLVSLGTSSSDLDADPPFCGLDAGHVAWCWGDNSTGVLGDGSTTSRNIPLPVATQARFTKLAVGSHHACGVTAIGEIWCWGSNESAQVGLLASTAPVVVPRRLIENVVFSDVAVITDHATCGVGVGGGGVWCWGRKLDLGIGALAMGFIDGPSTPHAIYVATLPSPGAIGRIDRAAVAVGPPGNAAWWGDLGADVDLITTITPRPFVRSIGLRSLGMAASSGLVCGPAGGGDDQFLCGRVASLAGYASHQLHPTFAGFGMPFP